VEKSLHWPVVECGNLRSIRPTPADASSRCGNQARMWDPYRWMRDEERERTKIYARDVGCGASGSDERLDTRAAAHAEQTGVRICLFWRRVLRANLPSSFQSQLPKSSAPAIAPESVLMLHYSVFILCVCDGSSVFYNRGQKLWYLPPVIMKSVFFFSFLNSSHSLC
jgi:hypothetical protein